MKKPGKKLIKELEKNYPKGVVLSLAKAKTPKAPVKPMKKKP